ncbi:hypothetical protein GPECTOR_25g417 [Gonium pectorale]|uniref:Uncharacterized protein n=1 Tax=Gonium pectorale TaxID=33097 RepID=A0A150GG71_GONPE|nr:hypothetical protein GPECTOR_25g417 [Gonium pectorale]|eukprot:KXZ48832.1 hypothetical protein GPECTOR_25g417 [Gonium pectorale]
MDREKAFTKALAQYRAQCTELFGLIRDEEKNKIRRWEDEKPSLELLIASLNQDTRRILADEMQSRRSDLARLDASSRLEAERRRQEESGWAEVAGLEEALERTTARLDRAKQQLYFPEVKGYRFSSGNGGIYVAAHDLHVSEVSGRFEFTVEPIAQQSQRTVPQQQQQQRPAGGAGAGPGPGPGDTSRLARLTVVLGGVSSSTALAERAEWVLSGMANWP